MNDGKEVVIVTGSSGYIGSALIHEFAEKYRLVGFDRDIRHRWRSAYASMSLPTRASRRHCSG